MAIKTESSRTSSTFSISNHSDVEDLGCDSISRDDDDDDASSSRKNGWHYDEEHMKEIILSEIRHIKEMNASSSDISITDEKLSTISTEYKTAIQMMEDWSLSHETSITSGEKLSWLFIASNKSREAFDILPDERDRLNALFVIIYAEYHIVALQHMRYGLEPNWMAGRKHARILFCYYIEKLPRLIGTRTKTTTTTTKKKKRRDDSSSSSGGITRFAAKRAKQIICKIIPPYCADAERIKILSDYAHLRDVIFGLGPPVNDDDDYDDDHHDDGKLNHDEQLLKDLDYDVSKLCSTTTTTSQKKNTTLDNDERRRQQQQLTTAAAIKSTRSTKNNNTHYKTTTASEKRLPYVCVTLDPTTTNKNNNNTHYHPFCHKKTTTKSSPAAVPLINVTCCHTYNDDDGRPTKLATADDAGGITLWNLTTTTTTSGGSSSGGGQIIKRIQGHLRSIIYIKDIDCTISINSKQKQKKQQQQRLVSRSLDGTIKLWNISSTTSGDSDDLILTLYVSPFRRCLRCCDVFYYNESHSWKVICGGGYDYDVETLLVYDLEEEKQRRQQRQQETIVDDYNNNDNHRRVFGGYSKYLGCCTVFNDITTTTTTTATNNNHDVDEGGTTTSSRSKTVIICGSMTVLKSFYYPSGEEIRTFEGHDGVVTCCEVFFIDDHGNRTTCILSGSCDKTLKVWNYHTAEIIYTFDDCAGIVDSCRAFSHDDGTSVKIIADTWCKKYNESNNTTNTINDDDDDDDKNNCNTMSTTSISYQLLHVWDFKMRKQIATIGDEYHGNYGTSSIFADGDDGSTVKIATGCTDKTIKIWVLLE